MNNINSYNIISKNVGKVNFLTWAGLRQAIPSHLKMSNYTFMTSPPSLVINDNAFNILKKKLKEGRDKTWPKPWGRPWGRPWPTGG